MEADWVRDIRDNCLQSKVPFFFKQWGGVFKKKTGRTLDERIWHQMPQRKAATAGTPRHSPHRAALPSSVARTASDGRSGNGDFPVFPISSEPPRVAGGVVVPSRAIDRPAINSP